MMLIAVDGGGSKTRCTVFDHTGKALAESESGPSNHLIMERRTVRDSLEKAIASALARCGAELTDVRLVCAGLAGVDSDGSGREDAVAILQEIGVERCAVYSDMVIAHVAALGDQPGVLALAGTGAVFLGRGSNGAWVRAGGWGYRIGDEGGAYWIGRMALNAASRACDGRGADTSLADDISRQFGIAQFKDIFPAIYGKQTSSSEIANLSCLVVAAAEAGDSVASAILLDAGRELAQGAFAVMRRARLTGGCRVSFQGSVLRGARIVWDAFADSLLVMSPKASIVPPAYEPIYGAYLLACRELGWESLPG